MYNILITELIKLKRAKILWLIPIGALVPVLMALLALSQMYNSYEPKAHTWGYLLDTVLVFVNYTSPAVLAVLAGFVFSREYQENTMNVLCTYPISRLKFYSSKLAAVLPLSAAMFALSMVFTFIFGYVLKYEIYVPDFLWIFIRCFLLTMLINLLLIPLAAFFGIAGKSVLPSAVLGIAYVMSMMFLNRPEYNVYIPSCIPALAASAQGSEMGGYILFSGDLTKAYLTLVITFAVSVLIGSFYYKNKDIT